MFPAFESLSTRWEDQDCYQHVNNVVAYSFFDTAVNRLMMRRAGFSIHDPAVGFVVNSACDYFRPFAFPSAVHVGIAIPKGCLGTSSVKYRLALFVDEEATASAQGSFTHVWVNKETQKPLPIPVRIRKELEQLIIHDV